MDFLIFTRGRGVPPDQAHKLMSIIMMIEPTPCEVDDGERRENYA
jgi:hypothetical protein